MSLDVSLKHSEYMFRHEILKVIIIEGGSPILAHLSQCVRCIINSYFKEHLLNYWMGWEFTKLGRNGLYIRVGSHVVSVRIHCTEKWRTSFHTDVLSKSK